MKSFIKSMGFAIKVIFALVVILAVIWVTMFISALFNNKSWTENISNILQSLKAVAIIQLVIAPFVIVGGMVSDAIKNKGGKTYKVLHNIYQFCFFVVILLALYAFADGAFYLLRRLLRNNDNWMWVIALVIVVAYWAYFGIMNFNTNNKTTNEDY